MNQYNRKSDYFSFALIQGAKIMRAISVTLFCMMAMPVMASSAGNFKIESIQIIGLHHLPREAVLHQLPLKAGDWFDRSKSDEVIKTLYATKWFKEIKLNRNGSRLEVNVIENPIISKVIVKGSHGLPQEILDGLLKSAHLVSGAFFNPTHLEGIKQPLIQQAYQPSGKYAAKVATSVTPKTENIVEVKIDAEPGPTLRFASVRLLGVKAFSEKRVLAELPISTHRFWGFVANKMNHCTQQTREGSLAALQRFYKNRGYYDIKINANSLSITSDRRAADWIIELTEGRPYKIGQYRIIGETYGLSTAKLKSLLAFKSDDDYSEQAIQDTKKAIQAHFGEKGYLFAKVSIKTHSDPKIARVHFGIQIEPGKKTYVRRIDFLGSRSIRELILRRLITQEEASLTSSKAQEDSEGNLQHSGFVNDAKVEVVPVAETHDQVDLTVNMQEKPAQLLWNPIEMNHGVDGLNVQTNLNFENFLGTGQDWLVKAVKSPKQMMGELGYKSSHFDVLGLQDARVNAKGHLSDHRVNFNFKDLFNRSPYVRSIKDQGEWIAKNWESISKRLKKEKPKEREDLPASTESTDQTENKPEKDNDLEKKHQDVKLSRYTFDEWGFELGLELAGNKSNNRWQFTTEFKSYNFYFSKDNAEKYSTLIREFVEERANQVDQFIFGASRITHNLKGHPYFSTGGYASRLGVHLAFSGLHKEEKRYCPINSVFYAKDTLNYIKVDFSGSKFANLTPSARLWGDHIFGFNWNIGFSPRISKWNLGGDLPFFDNYHSGRFHGYEANALGPKDNHGRMSGNNFLLKGNVIYFLPKLQGKSLPLVHLSWPWRSMLFFQFGNVYQDFSPLTQIYSKGRLPPLVTSIGASVEAICMVPMLGPMPLYVSVSLPLSEGGHLSKEGNKYLTKEHGQYFSWGMRFLG